MKVLIAEDNASSSQALAGFFSNHASEVGVVYDAEQARQRLLDKPFDVVIVHLNLPLGGASEVAQLARAMNPETVVIVVTAFGDGFKPISRSPRSNVFLVQKPFRAQQLLDLVKLSGAENAGVARARAEEIDSERTLLQYAQHEVDIDRSG